MSKRNLRINSKHKIRQSVFYTLCQNNIKQMTYISYSDVEYIRNAIHLYELYRFKKHKLWVELKENGKYALMVKYNLDLIKDLAPFWALYYLDVFVHGLSEFKHYNEFNSVNEVFEYYNSKYCFAVYPTPKELYIEYRKIKADDRKLEWSIKKDEVKFSKLSKKEKRKYKNKKLYTWN